MTTIDRRKFIASSSALLTLVSPAAAFVSTHTARNGFWWNDLDATMKLAYVIGFADGATKSNQFWVMLNTNAKQKLSNESAKIAEDMSDYMEIAYGQLIDGLDIFYKDFRNKRIHASTALGLVRDQIHGLPQNLIDEQLSIWRKEATAPNYDDQP